MSVAVPKRRFQRARRPGALREGLVGYGFVAVPMAVFLIFFIYPMGYAIYISRYDWGILGPLSSVGWGNYRSLWHDTLFRRAIRNTLEYTAWVVPAQLHAPLRQDAVVLKPGQANPAAAALVAYLKSEPARATLRGYGYEF